MKNSESTGKNNYIFDTTESDYPNNINQSISEYDKESLNNSTRNNAHKSKRLMISRRSSKKKVPEIKNENSSNAEILKTEIPNQKLIYPTARLEEENDPKNLSFTNYKELDQIYNKKSSISESNSNSNKFIIGRNILDTHRSNLMEILNKNFTTDANIIEEKQKKDNFVNIGKEVSENYLVMNKNINDNSDNYKNKFILKRKCENSLSKQIKNISNDYDKDNLDNDFGDCYDYNINETSCYENKNSKSASNILNQKKDSSNYVNTQRSDNFHKKNYVNSSFRRTYDNFNNYTTSSKSKSKEKNDKFGLLDKKAADKKENKFMLSISSNKDKTNKFKIKPIAKLSKNERNSYLKEKENQVLRKNYSESPTIKKSVLITENTIIDYSTKSNGNIYKRNNSSNIYTHSNINHNNQFNEESIELIIPTPYPKNPYMSLDSPSLTNSPYTQLLNKKYPPRKYLKHNLSSWLRYNNKHAMEHKEINIKLMNPKVDFKRDFNLKKLTYKNEDILDHTAESMTDIKKACDLIEVLKIKLLEYEITNNKNIDLAVEQIEKLEHENNFFRQKLLASYEELNFYKDKYDDDVLETNGLYDHRRYLVKNLRSKWLKQKFFYGLKSRIDYLKNLRINYKNFLNRKCFLLMFKGFLSLEKNRINSVVAKKVQARKEFNQRKKAFNFLKKNLAFSRLIAKFANIQKQICLILTFKNLRYNLTLKKYYRDLNKKGLLKYYLKTARKIFTVLKRNLLQQSSTPNYKKKFEDSRKINFISFFKNLKNGNKLSNLDKTKKTKGLGMVKNLVEKKILKMSIKYSSSEFEDYFENKFYKWKKKTFNPLKLRTFNFILAIKLMQSFFKKVKNILNIKSKRKTFLSSIYSPRTSRQNMNCNLFSRNEFSPFSSNSFNKSRRSIYNNFLNKCAEKVRNRQRDSILKFKDFSKQIYHRMFIDLLKSMQFSNPLMRFTRVYKKFQFSIFFDKVKSNIELKKKGKFLMTKFNSIGNQNTKLDVLSNCLGSNVFSERKNGKRDSHINTKNPIELADYAAANKMDSKVTLKTLFNLGKKFFRIVKYKSRIKEFYDKLIYKFKKQFIYTKNVEKLIRRILLKKIFSRKSQFENKLVNIKKIIEEKSDMILKIEHENNELRKHYENSRKETKGTLLENEALREKIKELEERLHYDDVNFKELFNKNLSDIKNLHSLLKNNEALLIQAKKREEDLQNKYCSDIQKAVSLNKQLNNIISKKNKLIADIKIKQNKKEVEATNETLKLYKENASLYNEYNKIMEIKEIEKHNLEEEKNKLKTNMEQLEMEKIKSDYKSTILEEENKLIYNQIIENIKQKK